MTDWTTATVKRPKIIRRDPDMPLFLYPGLRVRVRQHKARLFIGVNGSDAQDVTDIPNLLTLDKLPEVE